MSKVNNIAVTLDYDKFRTVAGNREVSSPHLRNLAQAIEVNDLLPYFPILVNEKFEVIAKTMELLF